MTEIFAHAFGQRYELPIPLYLFVLGGAGVVLVSFWLVLKREITKQKAHPAADIIKLSPLHPVPVTISLITLLLFASAGIAGSQEISENILPTFFWLIVWVAVPLSCGLVGDWTQSINAFANIAKLADSKRLRRIILNRSMPIEWPAWLGWWPATILYFVLACAELIFNQMSTRPNVIGIGILVYLLTSGFAGLLFGGPWLQKGEVFTLLFSTWGRLGFFRFRSVGSKGFAGGLRAPFAATPSRIVFVLFLLVSISFDGLLSTPLWSHLQRSLPVSFTTTSMAYKLVATAVFVLLGLLLWLIFSSFAAAVARQGKLKTGIAALAGLLPSLLPISFGYLLAHYAEYLVVNGQLMFPLLGNPIGKESWPIHPPYPFNDSYEIHIHVLPSAFYWYLAVVVIVAVHVIAVVIAHRHLSSAAKSRDLARRAEYPWIAAMVVYTMFSLWLVAQPLVKEKLPDSEGYTVPSQRISSLVVGKS